MNKLIYFLASIIGTAAFADNGATVAATVTAAAVPQSVWYQYKSGLGADGYDVVAYFVDKKAVRGDVQFVADYDGKQWHFVSAANRQKFVVAPADYVPQYGGHCAYAASYNAMAFGDPKQWTLHRGKLYFNYSAPVRKKWERGINGRITKGDVYWRKVIAQHTENINARAAE